MSHDFLSRAKEVIAPSYLSNYGRIARGFGGAALASAAINLGIVGSEGVQVYKYEKQMDSAQYSDEYLSAYDKSNEHLEEAAKHVFYTMGSGVLFLFSTYALDSSLARRRFDNAPYMAPEPEATVTGEVYDDKAPAPLWSRRNGWQEVIFNSTNGSTTSTHAGATFTNLHELSN